MSYGGSTWYYVSGGDGGGMAFQHNDPHRFLTTWQGRDNNKHSLQRIAVVSQTDPDPDAGISSSLPDVPGTGADGGPPFLKYFAKETDLTDDFERKHRGIFGGKLQGHPTDPRPLDHGATGRCLCQQGGTTGIQRWPKFQKLDLPDYFDMFPDDDFQVQTSAIAYAPSNADNEWWIGTSHGEVLRTR